MRILFIGGTGIISSACSELAVQRGHELTLLNRSVSGKHPPPAEAQVIAADVHAGAGPLAKLLEGREFDAVVDFFAFTSEDIERDLALFRGRTRQFVFISSATVYEKPPRHYLVTEETPLGNPFSEYARNKIACERRLMQAYREDGFPATIVRPSLTYGPSQISLCVGSWQHPWSVVDRMMRGKPVIVPGDGTSLWVVTWNGDFAKGLVGLLGKQGAIGEAFHITSDEVLTWNQIYEEVFAALGVKRNIVHVATDLIAAYWPHAESSLTGDKINSAVFDNSKVKRLAPDFQCEVNWAEGVRRAISWHRAHPEFQTLDAEMERIMDDIVDGQERALPGS
jgi:nucleoside-diphosphate-sugar epimerase